MCIPITLINHVTPGRMYVKFNVLHSLLPGRVHRVSSVSNARHNCGQYLSLAYTKTHIQLYYLTWMVTKIKATYICYSNRNKWILELRYELAKIVLVTKWRVGYRVDSYDIVYEDGRRKKTCDVMEMSNSDRAMS